MKVTRRTKKKTSSCYVAYFDILGYRDFLKDPEANEYELLSSIKQEFETLSALNDDPAIKVEGLRTKSFSDNVVLVLETSEDESEIVSFRFLVILLCTIQLLFLEQHNLLIRGSVVFGDVYIDDSMVFGKGLVEAVETEEKKSVFPRIVIDASIGKRLGEKAFTLPYIKTDEDNEHYIDYFGFIEIYQERFRQASCVQNIRDSLASMVRRYCRFSPNVKDPKTIAAKERVIAKHLWVIEKFNEYCHLRGQDEWEVKYYPVLNERILKYELRTSGAKAHRSSVSVPA